MAVVRMTFSDEAAESLERLRDASGRVTLSEVFQDALGLYEWARIQVSQGLTVGALGNGKEIEVILPFRAEWDG